MAPTANNSPSPLPGTAMASIGRDIERMNDLSEVLGDVLQECLDHGMSLPFIMAAVSLNGCAVIVRFEQGNDEEVEATFLAEHTEVAGVVMPINIMVTDQTGEAVRIKIDQDGTTFH